MSDEQRAGLRDMLKGGQADREIPFARPDSLTTVIAVASGKGGVGKSSVTVNLAMALAAQGRTRRRARRRHLRSLDPRHARCRRCAVRPRSRT